MIFLEEIASEIEESGFGTVSGPTASIFINKMNEDVKEGVLLTDRLTGTERYSDLPDYRMTRFSIVVRGKGFLATEKKLFDIAETINTEERKQLGKVLFQYIHAMSDPISFPMSDGDYYEMLIRFETKFVITDYN